MKIEKYATQSNYDKSIYSFKSEGIKIIEKRVYFTQIDDANNFGFLPSIKLYNIALGDWDETINDINDYSRSNNGDTEKVLATVAYTIKDFWEYHSDAVLFLIGSTPDRTRLYQIAIVKNFHEIEKEVTIYGLIDDDWQEFIIGSNYDAFLILQKRPLF